MRMLVGFVALVAVVGLGGACKSDSGKKAGAAAGFVDCNVVSAAIKKLSEQAKDPAAKERTLALQTAMLEECKAKAWSKEALQCINDATDRAAMEQCESKLSKEQQASAKEVSRKVLAPTAEAAGSGSGSGAGSGSGSGSGEAPK